MLGECICFSFAIEGPERGFPLGSAQGSKKSVNRPMNMAFSKNKNRL
jgi:hypothetical protein